MTTVYCVNSSWGVHSFYMTDGGKSYYLFSQKFRRGVHDYFCRGVPLRAATDFTRAHRNFAVGKTMERLPVAIKYVEKEYGISVLRQTGERERGVPGRQKEARGRRMG